MKLVIAEKPSVAQSLAAVLGAKERGQGYLQGNGYVVSWCVGHLIGLAAADAYDARYSKWCYEDLPIIPEEWKYTVAPDKKDQYEVLVSLMNRPDVESLVCATDAGREGELIFRLVYDHAGCTKPFERLWISSMEDSAIREGFENLRPGAEYDLLYEAALCRAKADWLVGISGTRLFSTLYRKTLNIGRVMTPTLALVVDRETAISDFKKEKFYTVVLDCGKFTAASERCENRKAADHLSAACSTQAAVVQSVEKKQKSTQPPKLYDLTSLQRDGKGRVVVSPGFKEIEQAFFATLKKKPEDDSKDEDAKALPPLAEGQTFEKVEASTKEGTTSPPRHFTEDLLLSAMEHASAEEFAEIEGAERTGLGTPATRAGVLEKLVRGGFLERKGRQLLPTKKGFNLIVVLPDSVKSARLTAQWEAGLKSVERGEQAPDAFMGGIEQMVSDLVAQYSAVKADTSLFQQREVIGKCPRCGSDVLEGKKNFYCSNRECQFSMWKDDRFFTSKHKELTKPMAAALLKNGRIKMKGLFSEKKGVLYDAVVVLADTGEKYVNYKIELPPRPKTKGKE